MGKIGGAWETFLKQFEDELAEVDEIAQMVLKGHMQAEAALDDLLGTIFLHPEYLRETRLSFFQKLQIARSYTPERHDAPEWQIIGALNAVRNEIAHGRESTKRAKKLGELRKALSKMEMKGFKEYIRGASDKRTVFFAASIAKSSLDIFGVRIRTLRKQAGQQKSKT